MQLEKFRKEMDEFRDYVISTIIDDDECCGDIIKDDNGHYVYNNDNWHDEKFNKPLSEVNWKDIIDDCAASFLPLHFNNISYFF